MTSYTDLKARLRARAGKWVEERFGGIVWVLDDPDLPAEALVAIEELEQRGQVVVTKNDSGCIVAVTRQDDEGRVLSVIAEAAPAPAAEPVAWRPLTDEDRRSALEAMPDWLDGFLKKWGWLNFAKEIERRCMEKNKAAPQPAQAEEGK